MDRDSKLIEVLLPDGRAETFPVGQDLLDISRKLRHLYPAPIVAALVNNKLQELFTPVCEPAKVRFLDLTDKEGIRIYQRSLTFLFIYAVHELFPEATVKVEHSLGKGLYCEIEKEPPLKRADVKAIEQKMWQLVHQDIPFAKESLSLEQAQKIFSEQNFADKVQLLKYWPKKAISMYSLNGFHDTLYGYHVPSTGYLEMFALEYYRPGVILRFPVDNPFIIPPFGEQPKLFGIFREAENWGNILGFDTVGALNNLIRQGKGSEVIRVVEALHEKKIAQIADMIANRRDVYKIILIAGPSSSGKTTFAQRLRTQLMVNGLRPYPLSLDDYFVDRDKTPLDESNNPDFEHIEAIDLPLFNEHLLKIIEGEEVEIPTFNFTTGTREYNGKRIKLDEDQPLIIEGIHALNERLTASIPRKDKFKIYISALTTLNIDHHTRIHTTDVRLIRRIVRDSQFRGTDALTTIRRWPSVRRGEERNIFFLQEEADVMFNSALAYELAVLRDYAIPLLEKISRDEPEYVDASRLRSFLSLFVSLDPGDVPTNSILREFIGESCFFRDTTAEH